VSFALLAQPLDLKTGEIKLLPQALRDRLTPGCEPSKSISESRALLKRGVQALSVCRIISGLSHTVSSHRLTAYLTMIVRRAVFERAGALTHRRVAANVDNATTYRD
jgi:hypothetical protein